MDNSERKLLLHDSYTRVKNAAHADYAGGSAGKAIKELVLLSSEFLAEDCQPVALRSCVPGKEYISYAKNDATKLLTRPVNKDLFIADSNYLDKNWSAWLAGTLDKADLARISYTVAVVPCLGMELFDRQNKKGPATYFECFVGHVFAREFGANPRKKVTLPVEGRNVRMTMDFIFDIPKTPKSMHLAVKMSTRERVVQAWAHQRLLDAAFGPDKFFGVMALFSETKLDLRKKEVVEICVPDQWVAYQKHLATIDRIYYFDTPSRYDALAASHPGLLHIKQFGEFFKEKGSILHKAGVKV
jgi:hypothetical protein